MGIERFNEKRAEKHFDFLADDYLRRNMEKILDGLAESWRIEVKLSVDMVYPMKNCNPKFETRIREKLEKQIPDFRIVVSLSDTCGFKFVISMQRKKGEKIEK